MKDIPRPRRLWRTFTAAAGTVTTTEPDIPPDESDGMTWEEMHLAAGLGGEHDGRPVVRPYVGPMGSGSVSSPPWCSECGGWHINIPEEDT